MNKITKHKYDKKLSTLNQGRNQDFAKGAWASAAGGKGDVPPGFSYMVDRGLLVLFFGPFLLFSVFFFLLLAHPLEIFLRTPF